MLCMCYLIRCPMVCTRFRAGVVVVKLGDNDVDQDEHVDRKRPEDQDIMQVAAKLTQKIWRPKSPNT